MLQIYIKFSLLSVAMVNRDCQNFKKIRQYVIVTEPRKFDTADIKRFTVSTFQQLCRL